MIRVTWKDPNFRCTTVDQNDVPTEEIRWAASKEELEQALQARVTQGLIKSFHSVEAYDFSLWRARAKTATDAAIADHRPGYAFRSGVWGDLKPYLIQLFGGKCAYCEAEFVAVTWGDVEHYRPKGKVVDLDDREILVKGNPHPGYYWLAYDPANLMPSCQPCNQAWGKMNRFPIDSKGTRAVAPADPLAAEEALLLSPYEAEIDPRAHFKFSSKKTDPVPGVAQALTRRGEASIKAYHLNRQELIRQRARAQDSVLGEFAVAVGAGSSFKAIKQEYAAGRRAYSVAVLSRIERWEDETGIQIEC